LLTILALSRNSAGPSLIFPTYGSTFSIGAKQLSLIHFLTDTDYQSLEPDLKDLNG